jgi:Methyltransferase domain
VVLLIIAGVLFVCFAGVIAFGAPYLPTLKPQIKASIELANLKAGQTLIELGCGDGRLMIAAAKEGINSVGYEINPILVCIAWARTRRYSKHVTIVWGNFWRKDWPKADCIFTFLLDRYMPKLDDQIKSYPHKPVSLVSFAFKVPGRDIKRQKKGVYLYEYK